MNRPQRRKKADLGLVVPLILNLEPSLMQSNVNDIYFIDFAKDMEIERIELASGGLAYNCSPAMENLFRALCVWLEVKAWSWE